MGPKGTICNEHMKGKAPLSGFCWDEFLMDTPHTNECEVWVGD